MIAETNLHSNKETISENLEKGDNYRKNTVSLNVDSTQSIYETEDTSNGLITNHLYTIAKAHLPGNTNISFTIVDELRLINGTGVQELSIVETNHQDVIRLFSLSPTGQWYYPGNKVYSTQWSLNVEDYFNQCGDWTSSIDLWLTEGLDKDRRLIDSFKSSIVWLPNEPLKYQQLNSHSIKLTNTGIGKSFEAYILGEEPIIGATEASALGSYDQTRNGIEIKHGFLQGEGFPVFLDEINTIDQPLIQKLLTYQEQGKLTRGLKHQIHVEGTKTMILFGNPPKDKASDSLAEFLRVVCTVDEPERLGRRFGFLLLGDDYKRVHGDGDPSLRDEVCTVVSTTMKQYRGEIKRLIDSQLKWIYTSELDIEQSIKELADYIPHPIASDFVRGQSYGCIKKLKTSAIRYLILEQLNRVPQGDLDFHEREEVFDKLIAINEDSWRKLAKIKPDEFSDKDWALKLKADNPSMSARQIAKIVGISHTSVNNWLKEEL